MSVSLLTATMSHGLESLWASGALFPSLSNPFSPVPMTVKTSYLDKFTSRMAWFLVSQTYMKCCYSLNTWHRPKGWWNCTSVYDPSTSPIFPFPIWHSNFIVSSLIITRRLLPESAITIKLWSRSAYFSMHRTLPGNLKCCSRAINSSGLSLILLAIFLWSISCSFFSSGMSVIVGLWFSLS